MKIKKKDEKKKCLSPKPVGTRTEWLFAIAAYVHVHKQLNVQTKKFFS